MQQSCCVAIVQTYKLQLLNYTLEVVSPADLHILTLQLVLAPGDSGIQPSDDSDILKS